MCSCCVTCKVNIFKEIMQIGVRQKLYIPRHVCNTMTNMTLSEVGLLVGWFVCQQDNTKATEQISTKPGRPRIDPH